MSDDLAIDEQRGLILQMGAFLKVPARTRRDDTTAAIRRSILGGLVAPGTRLKDTDLALSLGVSRATVREAVRQLVHEGLIVHEPFRGLVVATIDDAALLDLADVRSAIESLAAQRLAASLTPLIIERLDAQLRQISSAVDADDADSVNEAHYAFHGLVHTLSEIPLLAQLWDVVEGRIRLALRIDLDVRTDFERIVLDHRAMLDTIRSRDDAAIAAFIGDHIRGNVRDVIADVNRTTKSG